MASPDHDISKLPKWAQQEIGRLTRDLAYAHAKLEAGPEDSNTFADAYSEHATPLGKGTTIEFRPTHAKYPKFTAKLRDDGALEVYGSSSLQIQSQASNVLHVRMGDYF